MNVLLVLTVVTFADPVPKAAALAPITEAMWKDSADKLKQLGVALHNFHDIQGHFPGDVTDQKGKLLLSWRVHLLPYLPGGDELAKEFKMTESWDSEHNKKLLDKMPKEFAPVRVKGKPGHT